MPYEDRSCGELILSRNNKKYAFDADTGKYAMIDGANPKWPDYTGEMKVSAKGDDNAPVLLRASGWVRRRKANGQSFLSCKVEYDREEERRLSVVSGERAANDADFPPQSDNADELANLPF